MFLLITRLPVGLSHWCEHKFKHSFQDVLYPIYSCGFDVESTSHYVPHCHMYNDKKNTLLGSTENIDSRLLDVTETVLMKTLLIENYFVDTL